MICLIQDGRTALYIASQEGHTEIVEILLNRGADISHPDKVWSSLACQMSYLMCNRALCSGVELH